MRPEDLFNSFFGGNDPFKVGISFQAFKHDIHRNTICSILVSNAIFTVRPFFLSWSSHTQQPKYILLKGLFHNLSHHHHAGLPVHSMFPEKPRTSRHSAAVRRPPRSRSLFRDPFLDIGIGSRLFDEFDELEKILLSGSFFPSSSQRRSRHFI